MTAKRQRAVAKRGKRRVARERAKSRARRERARQVRAGLSPNRLPEASLDASEVSHRVEKFLGFTPDPAKNCTCGHPYGSHFLTEGWPSCSDCEECKVFRQGEP